MILAKLWQSAVASALVVLGASCYTFAGGGLPQDIRTAAVLPLRVPGA